MGEVLPLADVCRGLLEDLLHGGGQVVYLALVLRQGPLEDLREDRQRDGRTDGRTDGRADGQRDRWTNGQTWTG